MMTTATPSRRDRSFISSRICAWMVTSSAVVGSSAISSLGLQARPMAIITRWRMPPDSWCGYWLRRLSGSVMPTSVSSSIARARAAASSMPRWMVSGSVICSPIFSTGLSEVIGSWKIMAMSRPRMRRISSSDEVQQLAAVEADRSLGAGRARRQQPHDGERRYRLAGARLADDGHHLAGVDRIAQVLDRAHRAVGGHELHVEVLDLDQGRVRSGQQRPPLPGEQTPCCRGSRRPRCSTSFLPGAGCRLLVGPSRRSRAARGIPVTC